jgi:hypothetical protein
MSVVHALPSSQLSVAPGRQIPPPQESPIVQGLPSSQVFALPVCTHPVCGLQLSVVHVLTSSQLSGVPAQVPARHASDKVHALPSLHAEPSAFTVAMVVPAKSQFPDVIVTEYVPEADETALGIVGFCAVDWKLSGPVHR